MDETTTEAVIVEAGQRIEELKVEAIEAAVEFVANAAGYAAEQTPLLVREALRFGLLGNGVWLAFWLLVFGAALFLFVKSLKWAKASEGEHDCDAQIAACIASALVVVVSSSLMLCYLVGTLQVIIAPRVYLLKTLSAML